MWCGPVNWKLKLWYRLPYLFWLSKKITELIMHKLICEDCVGTLILSTDWWLWISLPPSPSLDVESYCTFLVLIIWKFCQILLEHIRKLNNWPFFFFKFYCPFSLLFPPFLQCCLGLSLIEVALYFLPILFVVHLCCV